jgi:FkbM family methyltransferase
MPSDHLLGVYQQNHPLYDRFLPHLAKYLPDNSLVVDVGANVGDTLAAMYRSNDCLGFVCIEPDETFFSILKRNADRIASHYSGASITLIQSLVGASVGATVLSGLGGTKKAIPAPEGDNGIKPEALDSLIAISKTQSIALIKSDVDGFDYDVIDSAFELISTHRPLLFFECQLDHDFQKAAYERLIAELPSKGYTTFVVFDNFGEVLIETSRSEDVVQLLGYVWRQNIKRSSRTIYYFDILVGQEKHANLVSTCIADYLCINLP